MKNWKIIYESSLREQFLLLIAKTKDEARLKGEDYLYIMMQLGEITDYKITSIEPYRQQPMRTV